MKNCTAYYPMNIMMIPTTPSSKSSPPRLVPQEVVHNQKLGINSLLLFCNVDIAVVIQSTITLFVNCTD